MLTEFSSATHRPKKLSRIFLSVLIVPLVLGTACKSDCEEYIAKACEVKNEKICSDAKAKVAKWNNDNKKCEKDMPGLESVISLEGDKSAGDDMPAMDDDLKMLDADPKDLDKLPGTKK